MKLSSTSILALLASGIVAQRPKDVSVCDYYAEQILGSNTISTQKLLLTKLMNTVVLGSFETPNLDFKQNPNVTVLGIASPAVYNGTKINLLPLFTGELNSTNLGGDAGTQKLFLDDGGPVPLLAVTPAVGTNSVQYHLLTHIYEYFGTILGCSAQGTTDEFPKYQGRTSMYEIHRFMNLDNYQNTFFIWQLQTAALSLNFARQDVIDFGNTLQKFFNYRCSPATTFPVSPTPELQSICIAENCPLDPEGGDCKVYPELGVAKVPVNVTEVKLAEASKSASVSLASTTASASASASVTTVVKGAGEAKSVDRVVVGSGLVLALLAGFVRV